MGPRPRLAGNSEVGDPDAGGVSRTGQKAPIAAESAPSGQGVARAAETVAMLNPPTVSTSQRLAIHIAATALTLAVSSSSFAAVRFVRSSQSLPPSQQDGLSWSTAFSTLQTGIDASNPGDELRVAQGTYKPTTGTNRSASFVLKQGVKIRGGFEGTDFDPDNRSIAFFPTILSGEIGGSTDSDNTFHVVRANGVNSTTVLEGCYIVGGNANGIGDDANGGALLVTNASPVIARCVFQSNQAKKGGGIARLSGVSSTSAMQVHGCVFGDNVAQQGSAIFAQAAPLVIANSTIADNDGSSAVDLLNITPVSTFSSCILYRNTGAATAELSQFRLTSAPLTVSRCCIEGWDNANPSSATTIATDPKFVLDDAFETLPRRFDLRGDSPCVDKGECIVTDLADADADGNSFESLPLTIRDIARSKDDQLVPNGGAAINPTTDMGADELHRMRTILVNHAATGANTGKNWTDAYTSLQSALAEISSLGVLEFAQVWVAKGTYTPSTTNDPTASFQVSYGNLLLGGFTGNELTISQRNWRQNRTILSGELGAPGPTGNSHHVVTFVNDFSFMSGFIIRDGNAPATVGGGGILVAVGGAPQIAHCIITANSGTGPGSAIRTEPSPVTRIAIAHSIIAGNTAQANGTAGLFLEGTASGTIDRCLIAGNITANPSLTSGIRCESTSSVIVRASIITGNSSGGVQSLAAQCSTNDFVSVQFSAIQSFAGSIPNMDVEDSFAVGSDGDLVDLLGPDGIHASGDEDYRPLSCGSLLDASSGIVFVPEPTIDLNDDAQASVLDDFLGQIAKVDLLITGPSESFKADIGPVELQAIAPSDPDLNGSGSVDAADLALLLGAWNTVGPGFDLTGDCIVDASDLAVLLGAWD